MPLINAEDLPDGVTKRIEVHGRRDEFAQTFVIMILTVPLTITADIISDWIKAKYISRKASDYLKINGIEAKIDKYEIEKIIEIIISQQKNRPAKKVSK